MKILNQLLLSILLLISMGAYSQELLWERQTGTAVHSSPVMDQEYLYIGNSGGEFHKIHQKTGELIWQYSSNAPILADAAIWENLVIFSNEAGNLVALQKESGKLEWVASGNPNKSIDLWDYYRAGPVAGKDKIYWATEDGSVVALEPKTGKTVWNFPTEGPIHMSPVLEEGKLLIGNFKGKFFAIDAESGKMLWSFQAKGSEYFPNAEFQSSPTVDMQRVYIGSRDTRLYVLDLNTGKEIWNFTETGGSWVIASPLISGESVFFGSSDTYLLYAIDNRTGEQKWSIRTYTRSYSTPISYQNMVIMAGFDGKIRAYDQNTAELKWEYQTQTSKENWSNIYTSEGKFRNDLKITSAEEGENLINSLGPIISRPQLIKKDMFFSSLDGKIYAIRIP